MVITLQTQGHVGFSGGATLKSCKCKELSGRLASSCPVFVSCRYRDRLEAGRWRSLGSISSSGKRVSSASVHIYDLPHPLLQVARDGVVGVATRYELDGPEFESRRSQWPSGLRRGSAADR